MFSPKAILDPRAFETNQMKLSGTQYASKKPPLEAEIQRQILQWLKLKGYFFFRVNTGGLRRNGKWCPSPTITKGTADIIAIKPSYRIKFAKPTTEYEAPNAEPPKATLFGQLVAVEVKRLGGKQSEDQKQFQEAVEKAGGIYCLAFSVNDVRAVME